MRLLGLIVIAGFAVAPLSEVTGAQQLSAAAERARREGKDRYPVGDPIVEPLVMSTADGEFRCRGDCRLRVRMDVAKVVTKDWVYNWTRADIESVVAGGRTEFLQAVCAEIPRPEKAVAGANEVAIPLRRGSTSIGGVTLYMGGWQSRISLTSRQRYLLFGGFCAKDTFFLTLTGELIYPVADDGTLGAPLLRSSPTIEARKSIGGVSAYLASINKGQPAK